MKRLLIFVAVVSTALSDVGTPVSNAKDIAKAAFVRPVPENLADLEAIQEAARKVVAAATPATVGLVIGPAHGSGVIVSADGYVLTAAHVVGPPGQAVDVYLPDGRTLSGRTLGMYAGIDCGLVKILNEGEWPFVPLVPPDEGPKVGEWCLTLGHPSGFQTDRIAPVRLGRAIDVQSDVIRTDCTITSGDSGGPLLDLRGRVIGIHSRISDELTENLHGPVVACHKAWKSMAAGESYPPQPASRFLDRLDVDRDGRLSRGELKSDTYRRVFDRIADQLKLDPQKSHPIDEVAKTLGWEASRGFDFGMPYIVEHRSGIRLSPLRYTTGREVRAAFRESMTPVSPIVVEVRAAGTRLAYGTVVDADGLVLTKASQLRNLRDLECRMQDGSRPSAKVVAMDRKYDVALLRVETKGLTAAKWSSSGELVRGDWLVTPGVRGVAKVGVVSVGPRRIVGVRGVLGVEIHSDTEARVFAVRPNSGAAEAGVTSNDLITHIADRRVHSLNEIKAALYEYRAADVVKITVLRGAEKLDMEVTLGAESDIFFQMMGNQMNGPLSRRRDDFSTAIQHDSLLEPNECGGPVLTLSGQVVGMNVARADRTASYMLPSEKVKEVIAKLMAESATGGGG